MTTLTFLNASCQIDFSIHKLKIYSKGTLICSERILNVLALILSTPPDLFFIVLIILNISAKFIGQKNIDLGFLEV